MQIEDLSKELVQEMSDEEVSLWFSVLQQKEQANKMRATLLKFLDLRDAEQQAHTIKIPSRVVD